MILKLGKSILEWMDGWMGGKAVLRDCSLQSENQNYSKYFRCVEQNQCKASRCLQEQILAPDANAGTEGLRSG